MFFGKTEFFSQIGIRARITALFVLVFGSSLIIFSALLYQAFLRNHQQEFDAALYNYAVDVARAVEFTLTGEVSVDPEVLNDSEKVFPFALGETFLQIRTIRGNPIARSRNLGRVLLPLGERVQRHLTDEKAIFENIRVKDLGISRSGEDSYRLIHYYIDKPGNLDFILQIAVPRVLLEKETRGLLVFFIFAVPFILIVASLGGWFVSRRALAPVIEITRKLRDISARKLSERVSEPRSNDEIRELAGTINALLDRLDSAFRSQEAFVSDASHQLRTPLAILRGELDVLRSKSREASETEAFLESASEEIDYLSRMVADLLTLARMDTGSHSLSMGEVSLNDTVLEAVSRYTALARKSDVRLQVRMDEAPDSQAITIHGDPDLVRCMIENLVENAIKYTEPGTVVCVTLSRLEMIAILRISDQGRGITLEDRAHVFERFFRGKETARSAPGAGLGLAIVKRIIDVHKGTIRVLPAESGPGTIMEVTLPTHEAALTNS